MSDVKEQKLKLSDRREETMEQIYLKELFRLTLFHRKYKDSLAGIFTIEPTVQSLKTLKSYKLHFKVRNDGFTIVCPCKHLGTDGLCEITNRFVNNTKLSFVVFTFDDYFFGHSALPYNTPGKYVYYFNNLSEDQRKTRLLLESKGIKASERVLLHTKKFTQPIQKYKNHKIIKPRVFDCLGNMIPETEYDLEIDKSESTYTLDLSRKEDGVYTIQYNEESITCYCTQASFIRRVPLLILEIFTGVHVPEKYQVIKRINRIQYIDAKKFGLHFGDYTYFLRYRIMIDHIHFPVCIKVNANNDNYIFSPAKALINKGTDSIQFTSDQAIEGCVDGLEIYLYRAEWDYNCRCRKKHYYCNGNYGIKIGNEFMCRYSKIRNGVKKYIMKCPARCTEYRIGQLPGPGNESILYYYEDGKQFGEITVYLSKERNTYVIRDKPGMGNNYWRNR